jgi:hypothetical protein
MTNEKRQEDSEPQVAGRQRPETCQMRSSVAVYRQWVRT